MATRAVIARPVGDQWEGRYHHWDGYPTGLGKTLFERYHDHFQGDYHAMIKFLIDDHTGWSTVNDKDFTRPAGFGGDGPECYCHGERDEHGPLIGPNEAKGIEWTYVLSDEGIAVLHPGKSRWNIAQFIPWGGEPNWELAECGFSYRHCTHLAEAHFPGTIGPSARLPTRKFLGYEPLEPRDAIAVVQRGTNKKYEIGPSGRTVRGFWESFATDEETGEKVELRTFRITADGYEPLMGLEYVYPPTLNREEKHYGSTL